MPAAMLTSLPVNSEDTEPCPARARLEQLAQHFLMEMSRLAREEVDVVASGDRSKILDIDKRIENALGEKERALGALYQHRQEHGC